MKSKKLLIFLVLLSCVVLFINFYVKALHRNSVPKPNEPNSERKTKRRFNDYVFTKKKVGESRNIPKDHQLILKGQTKEFKDLTKKMRDDVFDETKSVNKNIPWTPKDQTKDSKDFKIFVYPNFFSDECYNSRKLEKCGELISYGEKLKVLNITFNKWLEFSGTDSMKNLFLWKLLFNKKYLTYNPEEADFFFIPVNLNNWKVNSPLWYTSLKDDIEKESDDERFQVIVEKINEEIFSKKYFERNNGKDHFVFFRIVPNVEEKWIAFKKNYLRNKLFQNITFFASDWYDYDIKDGFLTNLWNSMPYTVKDLRKRFWENIYGVPYTTFFHFSKKSNYVVPWDLNRLNFTKYNDGNSIVSFIGSLIPMFGEKSGLVRKKVASECYQQNQKLTNRNYSIHLNSMSKADFSFKKDKCIFLAASRKNFGRDYKVLQEIMLELTDRSTFCIQIPGDGPGRRGIWQSIIRLCIPVVSDIVLQSYRLNEPFFNGKKWEDISIIYNIVDVKSRKFNIIRELEKIPQSRIDKLRQNLSEIAPLIHFSHWDTEMDDLFESIIKILKNSSSFLN